MIDHKLLKHELRSSGYRLDYISAETDIPYDSMIQYLNGHRPIPESRLRLLCDKAKIDISLFGLDTD